MAAVTLGALVPDKERGPESGQTFLVRPQGSRPVVFPFSSFSRSDHSGWDPPYYNEEESTHEEE